MLGKATLKPPKPTMTAVLLRVEEHEGGVRIDRLLSSRFPEQSRAYFQYLIAQDLVLLNKQHAKKGARVTYGDEIEVEFSLAPECSLTPEEIPLDIVFEDEWLLAINKPAGLVVHPGAGHWTGTFANALLHHCHNLPSVDPLRPGIVHRLDKETTGLLLAAKRERAQVGLLQGFAERTIKKEYLAICCGSPAEGTIEAPLGRCRRDRKRQAVIEGGREATTQIEVLQMVDSLAFVRARPVTGRTHQIRVHLRHAGAPILGDPLYGWPHWNAKYRASRQLLHAHRLSFTHPISGHRLTLQAPLPDDFPLSD